MNSEPRFTRTAKKAAQFVKEHAIHKLPIHPAGIVEQHPNWRLKTYDSFAERHDVSTEDVIVFADSIDGCAYYQANRNRFMILYNDHPLYISNPRRILWTLIHEIGHIYLNHLKETGEAVISRNTLSKTLYQCLETEANFFAASVLAPYVVLHSIGISGHKSIMSHCGLSQEAAQNREKGLKKWKARRMIGPEDVQIYQQFFGYIHQKLCGVCGFGTVSRKARYCPICGGNLVWGEGKMVYDDAHDLDEHSKAIICPRCSNEELDENGEFCPICGAYLINKCSETEYRDHDGDYVFNKSCDHLAAGNARYCVMCGNVTTFFRDEHLRKWDQFQEDKEREKQEALREWMEGEF